MKVRPTFRFATSFALAAVAFAAEGADVFRCELNGKVTYSDTACAKASDKTEVQTTLHNTYNAPPVTKNDRESDYLDVSSSSNRQARPAASDNKKSASIAEEQAQQKAKCQGINAALSNARKVSSAAKQTSLYDRNGRYSGTLDSKTADQEAARLESERKKNRCPY